MEAAFRLGMRHVDHFWCAMSSVVSLRPRFGFPMQASMAEFVLSNSEMSTEVIADGCHLSPELIRFAWQIKGCKRLCLVSDCNRAMDMPAGRYAFGDQSDENWIYSDGHVGRTEQGGLASSVMAIDSMIRNVATTTDIPLHEIIRMASLTPAERTGIADKVGSISVGKKADLVILSNRLQVENVYLSGQLVLQHTLDDIVLPKNGLCDTFGDWFDLFRLNPKTSTTQGIMALQIYISGKFYDKEDAKVSVYDHGLLYGDGVFEGMRSYSGKVFRMKEHIDRLYESANAICLSIPLSKSDMEAAVYETLTKNGLIDAYIRLVVTRGAGSLGLDPIKPAILKSSLLRIPSNSIPLSFTTKASRSSPPQRSAITLQRLAHGLSPSTTSITSWLNWRVFGPDVLKP